MRWSKMLVVLALEFMSHRIGRLHPLTVKGSSDAVSNNFDNELHSENLLTEEKHKNLISSINQNFQIKPENQE